MRGRARSSIVCALWLVVATGASAGDLPRIPRIPRIEAIRAGAHDRYDRVVVQLDGEVRVERAVIEPSGEVVLSLAAHSDSERRTIATRMKRVASVAVRKTDAGTEIRLRAKAGRVRAFRLREPHRLVIDVADPGHDAFGPPGRVPGVEFAAAGVREEAPMPPPTPPPAPRVTAEVTPPAPAETAAKPPAPPAPMPVAPPPPPAPVERPVAAPTEAPTEAPTATPRATQWIDELPSQNPWVLGFWSFVLVLLGGLVAGFALYRSMHRAPSRTGTAATAEDEIVAEVPDEARIETLEKRIDEELRARLQVEGRVFELQQELKVLRDRLQRRGQVAGPADPPESAGSPRSPRSPEGRPPTRKRAGPRTPDTAMPPPQLPGSGATEAPPWRRDPPSQKDA